MTLAALLVSCALQAQTAFGGMGPHEVLQMAPPEGCLSPAQRAWVEAQLGPARARFGGSAPAPAPGSAPRAAGEYAFYPAAANFGEDLQLGGFVDLDPAWGAFHDFECGVLTYDGHAGIDTAIRSFEEQDLGVPILAARDGTVIFTRDGYPDRNLSGSADPGNYVVIAEGGGREASSYHLKKNSIVVSVGQGVRAGEVVGFAASSGNSYYPHLHFELRDSGVVYEPFAGPCRPGPSGWQSQEPVRHTFRMLDGSPTWQDLWVQPPLPWPQPRDGDFAFHDGFVYFWHVSEGLPPSSVWRHIFERPDGSVAFDSGDLAVGNAVEWQWFSGFWSWWIPEMHTISGTWHWRHVVNGVEAVRAPIEVVPSRVPGFNRPPEPVELELEPPVPAPGAATLARVRHTDWVDDPDYDVLRYTYTWRVDGAVVRAATHAGRADALPAGRAALGQTVQCTVVVSDGAAEATPAHAAAVVGGADLALGPATPALAGTTNTWPLDGATPGATVHLGYALAPGASGVPGCPALTATLAGPTLAATAAAGPLGHADFRAFVPAVAAGYTVFFQAAELATCRLSNLLVIPFG